ncbi:MAG: DUF6340 family protein [Brumimicrobium sp.]
MNNKVIFYYLLFTFFAVSCKSPFDSIAIKTGKTSKTLINVPTDFKQKELIIIDRIDCVNEPFSKDNNDLTKVKITSNVFEYLNKEIEERGFYKHDQEVMKLNSVCANRSSPESLDGNEALKYTNNKNVLLTVENIVYSEKDNFRQDVESTYDKNKVLIKERNVIIGEKIFTAQASIKVYDTLGKLMDSIVLEEEYSYEVKESNKLTAQMSLKKGRDLAMTNIGKIVGFKIAESVSPYYIDVVRYYYAYSRSNSSFNVAQDIIIDEEDWLSASFVWTEITERSDDEVERAKAYFNRGVYHEKIGEFELAIKMLEESKALNEKVGGEYLEDLKGRYGEE